MKSKKIEIHFKKYIESTFDSMDTQHDYADEAKKFVANLKDVIKMCDIKVPRNPLDDLFYNFAESTVTSYMDRHTAYQLSYVVVMTITMQTVLKRSDFVELCSTLKLPIEFVNEVYNVIYKTEIETINRLNEFKELRKQHARERKAREEARDAKNKEIDERYAIAQKNFERAVEESQRRTSCIIM